MNRISVLASAFIAMLLSLVSCSDKYTTYKGPEYILFSDTLYEFPVQNSEDYFEIPVVATTACDYDRTVAVEVNERTSNAIFGKHYTIESNTLTIKAGELVANVKVRGSYDNIEVNDSLGFSLRLITDKETEWDVYGTKANVLLKKACPFDINNFTGYCLLTSSFLMQYGKNGESKLVRTELDPKNENTIIVKDYLFEGYDIRIKFDPTDILKPLIEWEDQRIGTTAEPFYTKYGDGYIYVSQPQAYTSYFSSCEKFILQYMSMYTKEKDGSTLVFGTYVSALEWVSDDEGEKLKREGY